MMKILACFFSFLGMALGKGPAGMVLYAERDGEVVLLLASHQGNVRGFAAFGGKDEVGESVLETAARETEEETRGYFKREWLKKAVGKQKPVVKFGYSMYFVEVPYVEVGKIKEMVVPKGKGVLKERDFYVWVPAKDVLRVLNGGINTLVKAKVGDKLLPEGVREDYYWRLWLLQMLDAKVSGKLPFVEGGE